MPDLWINIKVNDSELQKTSQKIKDSLQQSSQAGISGGMKGGVITAPGSSQQSTSFFSGMKTAQIGQMAHAMGSVASDYLAMSSGLGNKQQAMVGMLSGGAAMLGAVNPLAGMVAGAGVAIYDAYTKKGAKREDMAAGFIQDQMMTNYKLGLSTDLSKDQIESAKSMANEISTIQEQARKAAGSDTKDPYNEAVDALTKKLGELGISIDTIGTAFKDLGANISNFINRQLEGLGLGGK